jgi:hypothetical protein
MKQGVVDVMFILIDFLILYRRAALAREERKNDISKLLQFSKKWEHKMNVSTTRYNWMRTMWYRMCSRAMLASVRNMKTLEMRLPLTPHIKQTYIECCLKCSSDRTISCKMWFSDKLFWTTSKLTPSSGYLRLSKTAWDRQKTRCAY